MASYNSTYTGSQHDSYVTKQQLIDLIYPIGSYYMSANATDPGILFGGTWIQIKDRFILAAGDNYIVGNTGGSASGNTGGTALTESQLPVIDSGNIQWHGQEHGTHIYNIGGKWYGTYISGKYQTTGQTSGAYSYGPIGFRFGGGETHNHTIDKMPPYLVAYIWQRTG